MATQREHPLTSAYNSNEATIPAPRFGEASAMPDRFEVCVGAAKLARNVSKPSAEWDGQPGPLQIFKASRFQAMSTFAGYDKVTVNPSHGTLPPWDVPKEVFQRLERGF
eukprot:CAMPEP_0174724928 /NCGR_PEP_ID=MMETSP1094-20130205/44440_1 /TAXON_ID=156173 /ORGANISM="Chrysochromulina brevifilum, Strain UTEX LB 985" /LENGTH=108 /DNA_ID=CAMNT_0015926223 /DNA_START=66 /DNA_END=392 /DNA_ORIENTATION=+